MPASVVDTSVLAALIYREPRSEEARELLTNIQLFEPPLLAYELSSVCQKKILQYPGIEDELLQALDFGLSLDIQWVDVDHRIVEELAIERKVTTYDAAFLWISNELDIPLLTFDERLHAAKK